MEQLTLEKILHTDWLQGLCKGHQQFLLGIFDPIFAVYMNGIIRHNYLYNPEKTQSSLGQIVYSIGGYYQVMKLFYATIRS